MIQISMLAEKEIRISANVMHQSKFKKKNLMVVNKDWTSLFLPCFIVHGTWDILLCSTTAICCAV